MAINRVLMWACLAGMFGIGIGLRVTHPDLTETRLFLDYWAVWLLTLALACLAVWFARRAY